MSLYRVLFVCMGNICRSPAGECVFREFVQKSQSPDSVEVDSAGTIGYHTGNAPDHRMQAAGKRRGYEIRCSARQVEIEDFQRFDLIIAMDRDNFSDLSRLRSAAGEDAAELRTFCSFSPEKDTLNIPDPYYGGGEGFERVLDLIESGCPQILQHALADGVGD